MKKVKSSEVIAEYFARTEQPPARGAAPVEGMRCACGSTRVYPVEWDRRVGDADAAGKRGLRREIVRGYGCLACWRRWR